jgi:TM2 domain-containing membrane protein YozV
MIFSIYYGDTPSVIGIIIFIIVAIMCFAVIAEALDKYSMNNIDNNKSKTKAAVLAFLFGSFGIHKYYLCDEGSPYLLFCWTGIPAFIGIINGIKYLCMSKDDFEVMVEKNKKILNGKILNSKPAEPYGNELPKREPPTIRQTNTPAGKPTFDDSSYQFKMKYYDRLKNLSLFIFPVFERLKYNKDLQKEFDNNPQRISECIGYDMVQILTMLYDDIRSHPLEAFSAFLLIPNENSYIINNRTYEEIATAYHYKDYSVATEETISFYIKKEIPNSIVSGNTSNLVLPALLQYTKNPLFKFYADALNRFAKLIALADELATAKEQENLILIYNQIYSPTSL